MYLSVYLFLWKWSSILLHVGLIISEAVSEKNQCKHSTLCIACFLISRSIVRYALPWENDKQSVKHPDAIYFHLMSVCTHSETSLSREMFLYVKKKFLLCVCTNRQSSTGSQVDPFDSFWLSVCNINDAQRSTYKKSQTYPFYDKRFGDS